MRVLIYAAGAYAVYLGGAEAFAPQCSGLSSMPPSTRMSVGNRVPGLRMGIGSMSYDDPADVLARTDALIKGQSLQTEAAYLEANYEASSPHKLEQTQRGKMGAIWRI